VEALIADATVRIQIEKAALLSVAPLVSFKQSDTITPRRFRQWLAKRYDRQALPDVLVNAVQKPIVKAVDKLHEMDDRHRILDGISEILFLLRGDSTPYQIDILFIRDERSDAPLVNEEDAAKLAGWIADVLRKGGAHPLSPFPSFHEAEPGGSRLVNSRCNWLSASTLPARTTQVGGC